MEEKWMQGLGERPEQIVGLQEGHAFGTTASPL